MVAHSTNAEEDPRATVVADLMRHAAELIRAELALARAEFADEARRARRSITLLLVGAGALQCGVLFLGVALPAALGAGPLVVIIIAASVITAGLLAMLVAWHQVARPRFVRTRRRLTTSTPPTPEEPLQ